MKAIVKSALFFLAIVGANATFIASSQSYKMRSAFSNKQNSSFSSSKLSANYSEDKGISLPKWFKKAVVLPVVMAGAMTLQQPDAALADGSRTVGDIAGSGLVFKDTLLVESFDDPKVQGVTLYISNFQRPVVERIKKGFFEDPSSAAVGCARTGKVKIADNINTSKQGEVSL